MFMVDNLLSPHYVERQREQEVRDQKEKERAEAKERERERQEKQRAAEQAVHKHFEESLRLAHKRQSSNMCWINNLPGPAGSRSEEEKRQAAAAAVQQHHQQQQHQAAAAAAVAHQQQQQQAAAAAAVHEHTRLLVQAERFRQDAAARERERAYYQQQHHVQQQSRPSLTSSRVVDYPPPAHSKQQKNSGPMLNAEKAPSSHAQLPKAEPNFYGSYPRYQPTALNFLHHENAKNKEQQLNKSSHHDQLVLVKTDRAELIPNPQQLMSDLKNSVIVKNDKSPGLEKMHPQSPKMRAEYLPPAAKSPFEYRSPSQSPHPALSHSTSPFEAAQNLASISKVHMHRAQHLTPHGHPVQQRQSPHGHPAQQRQSPHQQSSHHRHSPQMHHQQQPQQRQSPHAHPMHASPPYATSKPSATVASYPYPHPAQQPVHYAAAPPTPPKPKVSSPAPPPPQQLYPPPKARPHSRNDQPLPPPQGMGVPKPLTPSPYQQMSQHNLPPPQVNPQSAQGGPQPPPAHSNRFTSSPGLAAVKAPSSPVQCQPLDLGVGIKLEPPPSSPSPPKRKAPDDEDEVDIKKIKIESIKTEVVDDEDIVDRPPSATNLSRVSEASPLLATAATTITTVLNTSLHQQQVDSRPETPNSKPTPPPAAVAPPSAPVTPSPADLEKSNSPGPPRPQAYPVHKLKKAWLQRHSGEDLTDINSSDIKGSGSCVTLPMPLNVNATPTPKKEPSGVVNSLHSIGSMAVNSIKKPKVQRKNAKEQNGHVTSKAPENDDSSSSDPERKATPQKRVPPKVKRKKGGRKPVPEEAKRKKPSVSSTDSEKESGSDKESDTNSNSTESKKKEEKNASKEVKKRGRKPKTTPSKNGNEEETRKKGKDDQQERSTPWMEAIARPSISQLKKTGESFLQDAACFEVAPKLAKCRECRWTPHQRNRNTPNIFCRFFAFRRLRYTKNGQLAIAGFSDPRRDAKLDDLKLWMPPSEVAVGLDVEMSKFLLAQVGDQFCDLLLQEKEAIIEHISEDKTIAWKRVVQGVREMCDVCETTLFNFHWACGKCGFVVCIDCYKGRKSGTIKPWGEAGRDRDELSWLLCTNRQPHEQEKLMLTQIIAGDSLAQIGQKVHDIRSEWGQVCQCRRLGSNSLNGKNKGDGGSGTDDEKDANYSTLRELLIRPSGNRNGSRAPSPVLGPIKKTSLETLDQVISTVIENSVTKEETSKELKHFVRRYRRAGFPNGVPPIDPNLHVRIMTMTESSGLYPDVPHGWLCDGRLLRLLDSDNAKNYQAFQEQWKRGQPVMISEVSDGLDANLWTPASFAEDFGDSKNDLVNCMTGDIVPNQPMRKFWEGFDSVSKRLKDDSGSPMILKLKDWPPGEDFAEMLPSRFADLMKALPMAEYTHRNGRLNLASRLPDCFVRPDLGPKMYTAYGSAVHPSAGTTNLHLDISDAVNVMVYVGIPNDVDAEACNKEVFKAIDEANCDMLTRRRVREKGVLPGALWHIYLARDADKIRDLLNKVALEKGARLEPHHDPIHDQSWYLDLALRQRLSSEYGVEGYSIVQCLGDAVFIPAGAPHQVRNLHNCIKVAEDFVSPENVSHCFHLTQEFRELSDTHTNHEDKLQIKNIMYHAVKDSLAVLANSDPALYRSKSDEKAAESGDDAKNGDDAADA
ncbi:JmjC domain, hydroxylase [Nesidiocoris tenuis]|uniref:JmjC domain, hydroxylase n=1 Tax=Nesidiocoris tenuis TaxID=355587 RepID=A0ABN7BBP4_9HEMI|nr:JmjC domain, hydroxylase [Nesidiocoris tenuis]